MFPESKLEIVELMSAYYVPVVEKKRKRDDKVCRGEESGFDNHYPRWGK